MGTFGLGLVPAPELYDLVLLLNERNWNDGTLVILILEGMIQGSDE